MLEPPEGPSAQIPPDAGYHCHRQGNANRAGPAALGASEDRYHHALCDGETTECEAGAQKIHRVGW